MTTKKAKPLTKQQLEEKKELARLLYMQGDTQKTIAEKTGISAQTITKWVNDNGWSEQRAAQNISRPELVNKLLRTIDKMKALTTATTQTRQRVSAISSPSSPLPFRNSTSTPALSML